MSKWRYVPVGEHPPQYTKFYGYDFELNGRGVDVDNPIAEAKMEHNPSFVRVNEKGPRAEGVPVEEGRPINPNAGKSKKRKVVT